MFKGNFTAKWYKLGITRSADLHLNVLLNVNRCRDVEKYANAVMWLLFMHKCN